MDAVSRLIYWQGDESRGVNDTAIDFLKAFNLGLKQRHPTAMLIAEDSTAYPGVTEPVWKGGLGFDYKWDLGWMHDTLEYFQTGPEYRSRDYHKLTFSMVYFWNERYMLEYCHDEVVHGKATILQKMYGDYEDKFPQARAMYMYMMIHPGKKLNFMGNEFGQIREWSEAQEQDWMILKYPIHDAFHKYMVKLNDIYKKEKAFHYDYHRENFEWLDCHQEERCIYAIGRKTADHMIVGIFNFSDKEQKDYKLTIKGHHTRRTLLHTEWEQYGGTMKKRKENIHLKKKGQDLSQYPIGMLGKKTEGFNGAEIEECIKEAMFAAYVDNPESPVLNASHIMDSISETVPLSTTMKEQIAALRNWAATRAKNASSIVKEEQKEMPILLTRPELELERSFDLNSPI